MQGNMFNTLQNVLYLKKKKKVQNISKIDTLPQLKSDFLKTLSKQTNITHKRDSNVIYKWQAGSSDTMATGRAVY